VIAVALSGTELSPDEPIEALCDAAAALGVEAVELWHPLNTSALGVTGTLDLIHGSRLRVACVSTGSELYRNGGSTADQSLLLEAIDIAARCNAGLVNTYFGYAGVRDDDAAIATYARLLEPCLARADANGVVIALENEFNAFGHDHLASDITRRPDAVLRLLELVDSQSFVLNFDAANFLCAGVSPLEAYALLRDHIGYCHLKDVSAGAAPIGLTTDWRVYHDFDRSYVTAPIASGAVGWPELLPRIVSDGYRGCLTLEPHSQPSIRLDAWRQALSFVQTSLSAASLTAPGASLT
jgi:sugar phosphate isomerase/epimerase